MGDPDEFDFSELEANAGCSLPYTRRRRRERGLLVPALLALAVHGVAFGAILEFTHILRAPSFRIGRQFTNQTEVVQDSQSVSSSEPPRLVFPEQANDREPPGLEPDQNTPSALTVRPLIASNDPSLSPPQIGPHRTESATPQFHSHARFASPSPSAGVAAAACAGNPAPRYPDEALRQQWEGTCLLHVALTAEGTVQRITLARSSGHDILDQSALSTVRQWRFTPAQVDGNAVPSEVDLPVRFLRRL